jgi:death on curing protein
VTAYLDLDDLLAAAEAALGQPAQVRDIGLLQASAARPQMTAFGEDAYATIDLKAAALLHSLVTSHPLLDGNKRLGWVAVRLFYLLNGEDLRSTRDEAFDLVVGIAGGIIIEVGAIAERLVEWRSRDQGHGG